MSWLTDLAEVYNNCEGEIGVIHGDEPVLLPIAHSTSNAQIEIVIDENGNFRRANTIEKTDTVTVIPVTEDSCSRSSGISPHPLCDKLEYIAGDYNRFANNLATESESTKSSLSPKYVAYMKQLSQWKDSVFACKQVEAIYNYLFKCTTVADLIAQNVFKTDENNCLSTDKINTISQCDCFVRFSVEIVGELVPEVYKNKNVYDCYINYYLSLQEEKALCYASGEMVVCSNKHPSKIRNTADKSKLISSNDLSGYTFRGKFYTSDQVACIGYDISQKAHNALKWLISKQGFHCDEQWYIIFENHAKKIISINEGTFDMLFKGHTDEPEYFNSVDIAYTGSEYAAVVKKYIFNSSKEIPSNSNVVIMGLEAATPGRLSITLYQKLDTSAYFDKVENWHETCCWNLVTKITDKNDKKYSKYINYVGTPSVRDIVAAVCGEKASDKIKKDCFKRLMACIVDAKPIPRDMIFSLSSFASTPYSFENNYSYQKTLQIACALIRKYYNDKNKREVFTVALNTENTSRDYLFGRLLATAQKLEETALYAAGENRETSAERLHKQFAQKPSRTWKVIYENLLPYIQRLKTSGKNYYSTQINNILAQFDENDFTSTASLSPIYLLSYSSQLFEYNNFKKAETLTEKED